MKEEIFEERKYRCLVYYLKYRYIHTLDTCKALKWCKHFFIALNFFIRQVEHMCELNGLHLHSNFN